MLIEKQPRKFLGIMPSAKQEDKAFNKAHLKAYLKGKRIFNHGFDNMGKPVQHLVKFQERIMIELN